MTVRLVLIRHGETDDNRNRVFQGHGGSPLNALGRDQASALARRLASAKVRPSRLFASDLDRARETAEILGAAIGLTPMLDRALREVDVGAWQGLSDREVATRFADEWSSWQAGLDLRRGGGETYAELADRMHAAIGRVVEMAREEGEGATIVVSHGAAIKAFVGRVLGLGVRNLRSFHAPSNTGVSLIEKDARGGYVLRVYNDVSHLHDAVVEGLEKRST